MRILKRSLYLWIVAVSWRRHEQIVDSIWVLEFLKVRKKWWLLQITLYLRLLGARVIFAEGSAASPFMDTLW